MHLSFLQVYCIKRKDRIDWHPLTDDCIRATRRSIRSTKKPAALCKLSFTRGYYPNSYTGSIYLCETYGFHERDARRARFLANPIHTPCSVSPTVISLLFSLNDSSLVYPFKCIILFLLNVIIIMIKERKRNRANE